MKFRSFSQEYDDVSVLYGCFRVRLVETKKVTAKAFFEI